MWILCVCVRVSDEMKDCLQPKWADTVAPAGPGPLVPRAKDINF